MRPSILILSLASLSAASPIGDFLKVFSLRSALTNEQRAHKPYITVTAEGGAYCQEFPDIYILYNAVVNESILTNPGDNHEEAWGYSPLNVSCWQTGQVPSPGDTIDDGGNSSTYLRTWDKDRCYVPESEIQSGDTDWTSVLPNCGYLKPYVILPFTDAAREPMPWPPGFGKQASCYERPDERSFSSLVDGRVARVTCWVEGKSYQNGSTKWYKNAHKYKGTETCYLPMDLFGPTDGKYYGMPGGGGPC